MTRTADGDQVSVYLRRATALIVAGLLLVITIALYAGQAWPIVVYRLGTDGVLVMLWVLAAVGSGEATLKALKLTRSVDLPFSTALRFATNAAVGIALMSLVTLGLGLAGVLNRWTAVAQIVVGLACLSWRLIASPLKRVQWREAVSFSSWLPVLLMPFLGMALVSALVPPGVLWGADDPAGYDVVEYHLQVPREWMQAGRIAPLEHNAFSYVPQTVEMQYLLGMELRGGPWAGMYVAQLMHLAMVVLTLAAVYGAAEMSAGTAGASLAMLAAGVAPWLTMLAGVAYNEGGLLLFGTLSIAWALRYLQSAKMRDAIVAGAMAGSACGAKLTGMPLVLIGIPAALLLVSALRERASLASRIRACIVFVAVGTLCFSPWLIRNIVWTGNPLFPEAINVLGHGHFTPVQVERWQAAHSPRPDQKGIAPRLVAACVQIGIDWRYAYVLIPLALIAIALGRQKTETHLLAVLLALMAIFWIGLTHLQSRFFVLAIPVMALLIGQSPRRIWKPTIAGVLIIAGAVAWTSLHERLKEFTKVAGLIGLEDLRQLLPEGLAKEIANDDRPVVLVGDAKAFWYPVKQVRYRTVFDVDAVGAESVIAAWIGKTPMRSDALVIMDFGELERFAHTYKGIPELPKDLRGQGGVIWGAAETMGTRGR
jgi:hypothetical protein